MAKRETTVSTDHLARIVAGRYHVWTSDRTIMRDEWSKRFKSKYWRHRYKRAIRHAWWRSLLRAHHANQDLCRQFRL